MKQGRSLQQLAAEIERQASAKRDFITPASDLKMSVGFTNTSNLIADVIEETEKQKATPRIQLAVAMAQGEENFTVRDTAHQQFGHKLKIPMTYYNRMLEEKPQLLADNVNAWLETNGTKHMVRTLDGRARAFLSSKYRVLDNEDLAEAIFPVLKEFPDLRIESCQVTDRKMYIKVVNPRVQGEVKKGDIVQAGAVFSTSEIGLGALAAQGLVFRLVCSNGMTSGVSVRKFHVGQDRRNGTDGAWEVFSDQTKKLSDKALFSQVKDITRAALQEANFEMTLARLKEAADSKPIEDPANAVEIVGKKFSMLEGEKTGILRHLATGGDLSKWGMINAVTRQSQDIEDYDRASDFEALGGKILDLNERDWNTITASK